MSQYYLIDTTQIKKYISELDTLDAERTLCGLDLLIENIQNNLLDLLQNDKLMIEIDHDRKKVSLLGDELPIENWKIIFDKEKNSDSIYNTFIFAIDYAKQLDFGNKIIEEIHSKE